MELPPPGSANGSRVTNQANQASEGIEIRVIDPVLFAEVLAAYLAIPSASTAMPAASGEPRPADYRDGLGYSAASTQNSGSASASQSPILQRVVDHRNASRRADRSREPAAGYSASDNVKNISSSSSQDRSK